MIRMKRIAVVVWATIIASLGVVLAEEPAAPVARPWKDSADFGLVLTTGNTENFNVSLTNKFVYTWSNAEFTLDAAALRTENTVRTLANDTAANTVVVTETDTTTAEMYALGGKYTHKILESFFWYVNAGWVSNKPSGIDNRYGAGGGLGYHFFKTEVQTLSMEFGVDYTKEEQTTGFSDSFAGARLFLGYLYNISKTSSFTEDLTLLENLDDTDDFRGRSVSALTASLTQKLALKVSLTLLYDDQPVVVDVPPVAPATAPAQFEFDKLDTILTAALVVNF
jgi:putative salt-induced outer membrane protein YdiY